MAENKKTRVIRDPIHDLIIFENNETDQLLIDLINTEEFQRLRRIKQLGFSDMVFPGANHSRFAHSIGVMAMARKFLDALQRNHESKVSIETRTLVLVTCLLHDVGHGPFSHTFEGITKGITKHESHEDWTKEIVTSKETEIGRRLSEFPKKGLPEAVRDFLEHVSTPSWSVDPVFSHIVSSQLDADRFDFLLRDAYSTGALYGQYDPEWLIEHLRIDNSESRFYLDHKGVEAAEMYVYARYHMYFAVYFHKTTRAAEVMLKSMFERFKFLLSQNSSTAFDLVPNAPKHLVRAFMGQMKLEEYLLLDDFTVWEFLKACKSSEDPILSDIASALLKRKLWKAVDMTHADTTGKESHKKFERAEKYIRSQGFDPEYYLPEDKITSIPYKPYVGGGESEERSIFCQKTASHPIVEISSFSEPIKALTSNVKRLRYYAPEKCIVEIRKIFAP